LPIIVRANIVVIPCDENRDIILLAYIQMLYTQLVSVRPAVVCLLYWSLPIAARRLCNRAQAWRMINMTEMHIGYGVVRYIYWKQRGKLVSRNIGLLVDACSDI